MRAGNQECIVGNNLIHSTCRKWSPFRGDVSDKLTPLRKPATLEITFLAESTGIYYNIMLTAFDFTNEITYSGQQSESQKLLGASHTLL